MPATQQVVPVNMTSFREAKAKRIIELLEKWAENSIQLGVEFKAVRDSFEKDQVYKNWRAFWRKWLTREIGITESHAGVYINVANKFAGKHIKGVSFRVLIALTKKDTPRSAEQEILERAAKGEKIGRVKAKKIINTHRPTPAKANEIAKETGKPTLASDGFLYLGADADTVKEATERRTVIYAVRNAIETLASVEITPTQLLEWALPHQLWTKKEEVQIEDAAHWLSALRAAWNHRK